MSMRPNPSFTKDAMVVPENELWLHDPKARDDLRRAMDWAQRHPPKESDPDATLKGLGNGGRSKRKKSSA